MKFGAVLKSSAAELPDTEDLFLKYKQLKKSLKRMQAAGDGTHAAASSDASEGAEEPAAKRQKALQTSDKHEQSADTTKNQEKEQEDASGPAGGGAGAGGEDAAPLLLDPELEAEFLRAITADVVELNDRYIEKEEDNVIKFGQLEEAAAAAMGAGTAPEVDVPSSSSAAAAGGSPEALAAVYRAFVDFHGELLMLFHWSVLAYTGLVKILKKHRKRTGAPLHAPHLENLLSQPFCSVEVTCEMARKAEDWVAKLAAAMNVAPPPPVPLPESLLVGGSPGGDGKAGEREKSVEAGDVQEKQAQDKARVLETVAAAVEVARAQEEAQGREDGAQNAAAAAETAEVEATEATRRIRAALNVWAQLHATASTPSTLIAPAGAGAATAVLVAPSNATNSSVV